MSPSSPSVRAALDALVPPFEAAEGDWDTIVVRAGVPASRRRLMTRRRLVVVAVAVAFVATLIATPAFGIRGLISGLFGRTNVPFTGKIAPLEIKRDFYDLGLGAPPSMAPHALASQARRVASFRVGPKTHVLWVAPTRSGGFCWELTGAFGGCLAKPHYRAAKPAPGSVNPNPLSVTYGVVVSRRLPTLAYPSNVGGVVRSARAAALTIGYADGTKTPLRFWYVSKPIEAGFFFTSIPAGHKTWKTRPLAVVLRDARGRVLSRQPFSYVRPPERNGPQGKRPPPQPVIPSPPLPAPTQPLQRGSGDGVTAVAGRNGVVVFDTTHATGLTRKLVQGRAVSYSCFGRVPYHTAPDGIGATRTTERHVAIRVFGLSTPFLGCDIEGTYGHRWPDPLHEHAAAEIPFNSAGRRFFADRAAARDLALFLRSNEMHTIRKLRGHLLARALRRSYGPTILALPSPTSSLPANHIGYAITHRGAIFIELSPTGRHFSVQIVDGRIKSENVKPLGFVF